MIQAGKGVYHKGIFNCYFTNINDVIFDINMQKTQLKIQN